MSPPALEATAAIFSIAFGNSFLIDPNIFPGNAFNFLISIVPTGRPRVSIFNRFPMLSNNPPNRPLKGLAAVFSTTSFPPAPTFLAIVSNALVLLSLSSLSCLCFCSIIALDLVFNLIGVPSSPLVNAIESPSESLEY